MNQIRIGTLVQAETAPKIIPQLLPHGFESFSLTIGKGNDTAAIIKNAQQVGDVLGGTDTIISSVSVFDNPLVDEEALAAWERVIDNAHLYGTDLVTGFTGRLPDSSVPDSIARFKEVFGELTKRAAAKGVRIAFENCEMVGNWKTGKWNIAFNTSSWELMFDAVPADNMGLQWEPCHQMGQFIDPIPQLRKWVGLGKIFNLHGKDATVAWDVIREHGIISGKPYIWHRHPGFGDSNWTDIITILRQAGYTGTIDIEGWHDPVYRGELEMTGQVHALNYLKQCRGGDYIKNPIGSPMYP